MTEGKFLDAQDLIHLTGYSRTAEQVRALNAMGIRHNINPKGEVIVLWAWLEGNAKAIEKTGIDWSAVS